MKKKPKCLIPLICFIRLQTTLDEINWTYPEVCNSLSEILEAFPSEAEKRFSNSLLNELKFSHHIKCHQIPILFFCLYQYVKLHLYQPSEGVLRSLSGRSVNRPRTLYVSREGMFSTICTQINQLQQKSLELTCEFRIQGSKQRDKDKKRQKNRNQKRELSAYLFCFLLWSMKPESLYFRLRTACLYLQHVNNKKVLK